jgi:hypothetical protein
VAATLVNVVVFWVMVHGYQGFGETQIISSRKTNNCMSFRKYIKGAARVDTRNHYQAPVFTGRAICGPEINHYEDGATYQVTRCHNQKITILTFTALKTLNPDIPVLFQYVCVPFRGLLDIIGNSSALLFLHVLFLSISGRQGRARRKTSGDKKLKAKTIQC